MNFAALCFEEVTHYYLRLTESYLEEKRNGDQLGQSIKQKLTGDGKISTQLVYQKYKILYRGKYNALTIDNYKHRIAFPYPFLHPCLEYFLSNRRRSPPFQRKLKKNVYKVEG